MKTAKEMFEELGFELVEEDERYLKYQTSHEYTIRFDLLEGTFGAYEDWMDRCYMDLSVQDLKAINKQVEELGWLDE